MKFINSYHKPAVVTVSAAIVLTVLWALLLTHPAAAQLSSCENPANPVAQENCLPGTTDWMVTQPLGDIEGFAYPPSVNIGESVNLYVNTTAANYQLAIYRSGYYGGAGGRLVLDVGEQAGVVQPACSSDLYQTGLVSCANWTPSYTLDVPDTWVSGVYVAKLTRADSGGETYMLFVVRDDARPSQMLYQQSLFTYHAYNGYGGKSLYEFNSGECTTDSANVRASHVSLFRPYQPGMDITSNGYNNFFRAEYPLVRWLEQQGYDVTYSTNLDTHRSGVEGAENQLLKHSVFISGGHDEYWTQAMHEAVQAARDTGVHLAFLSANTHYWRVRLEADPWTGEADSVVITYKTTERGAPDPSGEHTGTFRDPNGANAPENALLGVIYIGDNDSIMFPLRVGAVYTSDPLYRHTDLQTMPPDTYILLGDGIMGWEWDSVIDNGLTPQGLTILAGSPVYGLMVFELGENAANRIGGSLAYTTYYRTDSDALVFAAGTVQWSWGLGAQGVNITPVEPYVQQITYNLFADMGVQPATPSSDLILDGMDGQISASEGRLIPADFVPFQIQSVTYDLGANPLNTGRTTDVRWTTDVPTSAQVWLSDVARQAPVRNFEIDTAANEHQLRIDNLTPDTDYVLRVLAISDDGSYHVMSNEYAFRTSPNWIVALGSPITQGLRSARCTMQANPLGFGVGVLVAVAVVGSGIGLAIQHRRSARRG
jgi:hypothetical protein